MIIIIKCLVSVLPVSRTTWTDMCDHQRARFVPVLMRSTCIVTHKNNLQLNRQHFDRKNITRKIKINKYNKIKWGATNPPRITKPKLLPSFCKQISIVLEITPEVLSGAKRDNRDRREAIASLNQHLLLGERPDQRDNQINKPRCKLTFSRRSARNTELINQTIYLSCRR